MYRVNPAFACAGVSGSPFTGQLAFNIYDPLFGTLSLTSIARLASRAATKAPRPEGRMIYTYVYVFISVCVFVCLCACVSG